MSTSRTTGGAGTAPEGARGGPDPPGKSSVVTPRRLRPGGGPACNRPPAAASPVLGPVHERGDVWRAAAGGVVPARRGGVGADRADRDVVEHRRGLGRVDHRPGEPERTALRGLRAGPDALPRRRARAGAADDLL